MFASLLLLASSAVVLHEEPFTLATPAEVVARVSASCTRCDWGRKGWEAAALELRVDGRYSQHVFLPGDAGPAEHAVGLGRLPAGRHVLTVSFDRERSARGLRGEGPGPGAAVALGPVAVSAAVPGSREELRLAHAPILEARPKSPGRFTDLPLVTWVESDDLGEGRTSLRYSVVFSNEDGGTPPDRLLATWGRLTDLEFVYGVEVDGAGGFTRARYQGPEHEILEFAGRREGSRPILHVHTENNMLRDHGRAVLRFAPAPVPFDLTSTSREAVMDAHPWTYALSAREVRREGRVRSEAQPGSKKILDPRRYLTLEACAATEDATMAFSAGVRTDRGLRWFDSDAGRKDFRIGRRASEFPNGCFRGAVALPEGTRPEDLVALRFRAFTRAPRRGEPPLAPGSGRARLERVNAVFFLGRDDRPAPSLFSWRGAVDLRPDGPPHELSLRD